MPDEESDDARACPLAALCAEAERLLAVRSRAEREAEREEGEAAQAAAVMREADRSLAHLAARASDFRPASRRGALFTLALAAAEADALAPVEEAARLRRRLYALRSYLEPGPPALPGPVASRWMVVDGDPLGWLEG